MNRRILSLALLMPWVAQGQPAAFNFDSGAMPAPCILESKRTAEPRRGVSVEPGRDEVRASGVLVTEDAARGGVFIRTLPYDDTLGEAFSQLTVCLAFRASPLSSSPVFLERLVGGTSRNPGVFRFRSQSNSGDDHERRGTLRLYVGTAEGKTISVASTTPWIQQENAWNWVGVVFNKGRVVFYLNGERLGDEVQLSVEEIPGTGEASYFLRGGYGFAGAFDDLVIVPGKAFTDEDMLTLYTQGVNSEEIIKKLKE